MWQKIVKKVEEFFKNSAFRIKKIKYSTKLPDGTIVIAKIKSSVKGYFIFGVEVIINGLKTKIKVAVELI